MCLLLADFSPLSIVAATSPQVKRVLASGTPVRFNIRVRTEFGQQLVVVGGCATLGAWNIDNGLRLNWQEGHIWETGVELPAG